MGWKRIATEDDLHAAYLDSDAVAAIEAEDPLDLAGVLNLAKNLNLTKGTSANIDGNDEIAVPTVSWLYLTSAGATDSLDGIGAGAEGQIVFLTPAAGKDITLVHDGTVTAGKKLMINGEANVTLNQDHDIAIAIYDATATVWKVLVPGAGGAGHDEVTLAGTPDYITISGQVITRAQIDLLTDVTGLLPAANIHGDIARDSELHAEAHAPETHTGQGATAAELETLTDGSDADALHNHPLDLTPAEHTSIGDSSPHHAAESDASTSVKGIVELATPTETKAAASSTLAVTPVSLVAALEVPVEIKIPLADPIIASADTTLTPAPVYKKPWADAVRRMGAWSVKFESVVGGDVTFKLQKNGSDVAGSTLTIASGTAESGTTPFPPESFTEFTLAANDVLTVVQTTGRNDAIQAVATIYGYERVVPAGDTL